MEKYVIDANLFFNMEAGVELGKNTTEVINNLTNYVQHLKHKIQLFMPPLIIEEFLSFFKDKNQPIIKKLLSLIIVMSPQPDKIVLPSSVFYSLIDDVRKRSLRGLNIAEEEIDNAVNLIQEKTGLSKREKQELIGPIIKKLRLRYRQATRAGFLDSVADLDLILLAKEIDGFLVSADSGVIVWGRKIGVKEMLPPVFRARLERLLEKD